MTPHEGGREGYIRSAHMLQLQGRKRFWLRGRKNAFLHREAKLSLRGLKLAGRKEPFRPQLLLTNSQFLIPTLISTNPKVYYHKSVNSLHVEGLWSDVIIPSFLMVLLLTLPFLTWVHGAACPGSYTGTAAPAWAQAATCASKGVVKRACTREPFYAFRTIS